MSDDVSELDRIDPEPTEVKLVSGFPVEVVRLRTRQLFRLLRILTRGAGPALAQLDFNGDQNSFGGQLLGIILMAIPDAEQETIGFVQSMCKPAGLVDKKPAKMTKQESEENQALFDRFNEELFNPELDDLIAILEVIVENEAPELQALGKKLQHLWTVARKASGLGQPEPAPEAENLHLPEPTHSSSTSSAPSTDGLTSTSSDSPSAASGSARTRRSAAASTSS